MMFHEISEWLDDVLEGISDTGIPDEFTKQNPDEEN